MAHPNGSNGAAQHSAQSSALAMIAAGRGVQAQESESASSKARQQIRELLSEPFDPSEIKWRVTATSTHQGKHGPQKRGQLVAYADQRAYTDRLNEVFGEWGWTRSYDIQVAQNFERRAPGRKEPAVAAKVVVVSKVTIHGLGSHTGVGEEWADDQNAATRAEAQAFKRACACFGLGRYLYDLVAVWVDLDTYNRPVRTPTLPDWALPSYATHASTGARQTTLAKVCQLRQKIGRRLSLFVLTKFAGGAEPDTLGDSTLSTILQKFTDLGNGIDRLQRAAAAVGQERYSTICRELNIATESIDDIPDREALQILLARVEGEAAARNGDTQHPLQRGIGDARGRLLQAARQSAEKTGRRLVDIIEEASEGKLSLDGLKDLTDTDVPLVSTTISRITKRRR